MSVTLEERVHASAASEPAARPAKFDGNQHGAGYRPDIDGLRAIAILPVVLFHFFPSLLKGGFAGVDVFFVISGFLISGIIFRELDEGRFSFREFYKRRVNRIFPALILVLASILAFGWFTLLPDDYALLGKHAAAGAGFVQNLTLWGEAGYFDRASELKPLMHLWSLAIEEQFYIFYPLLVWGAWRLGINILWMLAGIIALSFWQNIWWLGQDITGSFFLPQARFWELLAGGLVAWFTVRGGRLTAGLTLAAPSLMTRHVMSVAGLVATIGGMALLHKASLFPGWWAVLPVGGAALMIAAGPQAVVNRLVLANRVMVLVGLISYPLYLWHWPVISLAMLVEDGTPSRLTRLGLMVLSFGLAWATWQLLEKPLRFGWRSGWKPLVLSLCLITLAGGGFAIYRAGGVEQRFMGDEIREFARIPNSYEFFDYGNMVRWGRCHSVSVEVALTKDCFAPTEEAVFLWGDSYAAALYGGMERVRDRHVYPHHISQLTDGHGPPFLRDDAKTEDGKTLRQANENRLAMVERFRPRVVLINWMPQGSNAVYDMDMAIDMLADLVSRIRAVSPASRVLILGPVPEWQGSLLRQVINYYIRNGSLPPRYMRDGLIPVIAEWDRYFKANVGRLGGAEYLSAVDAMCNADGCITRLSNNPRDLTAVDWGHLTPAGGDHLIEALRERIFLPAPASGR